MKPTYTSKRLDRFHKWYSSLSDEHKGLILARIKTMEEGSFGDSKPVGDGMFEARIHVGAGWRIYYIVVGNELILLMHGGTKRTQTEDIKEAKSILSNMKKRKAVIEKRNTETSAKGKT